MALDLGLTTHQLLSTLDGVVSDLRTRAQRIDDAIDRASAIPADEAAFRTAAVGRRPYISARTGPEGLLDSHPPPEVPQDWTALSVDGSHIDVDRHLPLRCHLINLGGCAITYGKDPSCELFSEPALAVNDADLYLRPPDGASGETLVAGPLLGALRTVREVERLADAVESLPDDRPTLALLDGTLAFWDLQRGQYPRYVSQMLIGDRLQPPLHRPPVPTGNLQRRRFGRPGGVRTRAGTGPPLAAVPLQPPGRPLRPGSRLRPGVEPLLLPQRRR